MVSVLYVYVWLVYCMYMYGWCIVRICMVIVLYVYVWLMSKEECIIMEDFNHGHIQWKYQERTMGENQTLNNVHINLSRGRGDQIYFHACVGVAEA